MDLNSSPRWEVGIAAFFVIACGLILWETRAIPPGTFEPLGSAPVPQATALLIMLLSLTVGIRAFLRLRAAAPASTPAEAGNRPLDAVIVAVLTVIYVALLDARVMDFAPLTAAFLFIVIAILIRFSPRGLAIAAVIAAIVGWGAQYIFTRIFVVDLPGL